VSGPNITCSARFASSWALLGERKATGPADGRAGPTADEGKQEQEQEQAPRNLQLDPVQRGDSQALRRSTSEARQAEPLSRWAEERGEKERLAGAAGTRTRGPLKESCG
jgi:hypothetical protein